MESLRQEDWKQIDQLQLSIFNLEHPDGLYFDEFMNLTENTTSDLFFSIYDCIYTYVPCVKNFLVLKENYKQFLKQHGEFREYKYYSLTAPIL